MEPVDGFGCDACRREASLYWRLPSGKVVCTGCANEAYYRKRDEEARARGGPSDSVRRPYRLNSKTVAHPVVCALCGRKTWSVTKHHLVPRSVGTDGKTAKLCVPCHRGLHAIFTNHELAAFARRGGLEALKQLPSVRERIARHHLDDPAPTTPPGPVAATATTFPPAADPPEPPRAPGPSETRT